MYSRTHIATDVVYIAMPYFFNNDIACQYVAILATGLHKQRSDNTLLQSYIFPVYIYI